MVLRLRNSRAAAEPVGFVTLLTGLAPVAAGGFFLLQKPKTESKPLPTQRVTVGSNAAVACGTAPGLEGLSVALELPSGGKWAGRAAADGSVQRTMGDQAPSPDAVLNVTVDSVRRTWPAPFRTDRFGTVALRSKSAIAGRAAQELASRR